MRIAACLVAAICCSTGLTAQEVIEWSNTRKLSKSDFRGRAPISGPVESMSWINIDASWGCEDGELVATARATFNPAQSWWRVSQGSIWGNAGERRSSASRIQAEARSNLLLRDSQLLEHEQLHFDIAEVAARRVRARFEDFRDGCIEPGRTEPIAQIIAEIDRDLQEEQVRYDRETAHGINVDIQVRWQRRIQQLLADLPARAQTTASPRPR